MGGEMKISYLLIRCFAIAVVLSLVNPVKAEVIFEYPSFYSDNFGPNSCPGFINPGHSLQMGGLATDTDGIEIVTVTDGDLFNFRQGYTTNAGWHL